MAITEKPTILVIGGAFHVPESYQSLKVALEAAGYDVIRPPKTDLYSDTAHVRETAEALVQSGRNVVVIAHSYGGQVCSNALHGLGSQARSSQALEGGISALVYISSYPLPEGSAALDKTEEFGNMDLIPLAFDIAEDQTAVPRDPRAAFVDPGVGDAVAEAYLGTLIRWNIKCLYQRTEHAAWREIPVAYIYTMADMLVPLHYQQSIVEGVEKAGVKVQTFEMNTGHCPHVADPEGVVDIVGKVISSN